MLDPSIADYYQSGYERSRLFPGGRPTLEFVRSLELLGRLLPAPPAQILDVGGGPGTYAIPLAEGGYQVHLVDPLPLHVRQAEEAGQRSSAPGSSGPGSPGQDIPAASFTASVGDARGLEQPDESQDAVVLFGPLYHLTSADERGQALAEARRVPLRREWADSRRHEQILFAARAVETDPSVIGFSHHFIAAARRP